MSSRADSKVMSDAARLVPKYVREKELSGAITHDTAIAIRRELFRFLSTCPPVPTRINRAHVDKFVGSKPAPATKQLALSFIRGFCKWCCLNGYMRSDPTAKIPPVRRPKAAPRRLNSSDARLISAHPMTSRDRVIVSLMLQEACRCLEVSALQLGDIDLHRLNLALRGKGGRGEVTRHVPLSSETHAAVVRYLAECPATAGPLIRRHDQSGGLLPNTISQLVTAIFTDAGVKGAARDGKSAHALRHTALSDMVDGGAPIQSVQQAAGHQNLTTTQIYINGVNPELRKWMGGRSYIA